VVKPRNYAPKALEGHKREDPTKEVKLAYLSKSYEYSKIFDRVLKFGLGI
jgi:hypothetical protein